ncbi:hypothetical protein ACI3E1_07165 [Ligilactobacillus sp. LYQ139]|uniref:hypothetical protein n=1 Tax=Ligilactobacillus sp. LYQ139 TaxID=3378800 RepID=UPI003852B493
MDKQEWRAERFRLASKRRSQHQCVTKQVKKSYIDSRSVITCEDNNKFPSVMGNIFFGDVLSTIITTILILTGAIKPVFSLFSDWERSFQSLFNGQWIEGIISIVTCLLALWFGMLLGHLFDKGKR